MNETIKPFVEKVKSITTNQTITEASTLASVIGISSDDYKQIPFASLNLSQRAFNCINRYLNPPVQGIIERTQVSDLLNLTIGDYANARNLGVTAFIEIITKIKEIK